MTEIIYKRKNLLELQKEMTLRGELINQDNVDTRSENKFGQALIDSGVRVIPGHKVAEYSFDLKIWEYPLLIEVDGGYHNSQEARQRDYRKDRLAQKNGFKVLRFTNEEVNKETQSCVDQIKSIINTIGRQPKEKWLYPLTIREQISRWFKHKGTTAYHINKGGKDDDRN